MRPVLSYHRSLEGLTFTWTGQPDAQVEVERDGGGEPLRFDLAIASGTPFDVLDRFKGACDMWVLRQ